MSFVIEYVYTDNDNILSIKNYQNNCASVFLMLFNILCVDVL